MTRRCRDFMAILLLCLPTTQLAGAQGPEQYTIDSVTRHTGCRNIVLLRAAKIKGWNLLPEALFPFRGDVLDGSKMRFDDFIFTRDRAHAILLGLSEPHGDVVLILLKCDPKSGTCNETADVYASEIADASGLTELTDGKVVIIGLEDDRCAFFFVITNSTLTFDHVICFEPQLPARKQIFLMDWAPDTYLVWSTVEKNSVLDVYFRNGSVQKLNLYKTSESLTCPSSGCQVVSSEAYFTGCDLYFNVDKVGLIRLDLNTFKQNPNDSRFDDAFSQIGRMSLDKAGNVYFFSRGPFCNTNDSKTGKEYVCAPNIREALPARTNLLVANSRGFSQCVEADTINTRPGSTITEYATAITGGGPNCFLSSTLEPPSAGVDGSFTVVAWVWLNQDGIGTITEKASPSNSTLLRMEAGPEKFSVSFRGQAGLQTATLNHPIGRHNWTHLAVQVYRNSVSFFVNGFEKEYRPIKTVSVQHQISDVFGTFTIAQNKDGTGQYVGKLQDLYYYSTALSNREIREAMTGKLPVVDKKSSCRCPASAPRLDPQNVASCLPNEATPKAGAAVHRLKESYFSCALNGRTNLSAYIDLLNGTSPGSSSCVRSGTDGRPDSPAGQTSTSFSGGGSDCYLSPTQTATSSNAYGSFTITAWIWINQTGFATLLEKKTSDKAATISLSVQVGAHGIIVNFFILGEGKYNAILDHSIPQRKWTHIAIQLFAWSVSFFINGLAKDFMPTKTVRIKYLFDDDPGTFRLGQSWDGTGQFIGKMQDVRFFASGLSNREIQGVMTGTMPEVDVLSNCRCPLCAPRVDPRDTRFCLWTLQVRQRVTEERLRTCFSKYKFDSDAGPTKQVHTNSLSPVSSRVTPFGLAVLWKAACSAGVEYFLQWYSISHSPGPLDSDTLQRNKLHCHSTNKLTERVDGRWGTWMPWVSYTDNVWVRQRQCDNPAPSNGGRFCPGITQQCSPSCTDISVEEEIMGIGLTESELTLEVFSAGGVLLSIGLLLLHLFLIICKRLWTTAQTVMHVSFIVCVILSEILMTCGFIARDTVECTLVASLCQYTATGSSAWVLMLAVHHVSQMASPHKPPRFFTLPVSAACAIVIPLLFMAVSTSIDGEPFKNYSSVENKFCWLAADVSQTFILSMILLAVVTLTVTIFAKWTFGSHPEVQTEEEWQNQFGGLRGNKVCARQVCFLTVLWSSLFYTTIFHSMFALCLFSLLSLVQALYTLMEFSPTIENIFRSITGAVPTIEVNTKTIAKPRKRRLSS